MLDNKPNYALYTVEELEDVVANVDKARFPERYKAAQAALSEKRLLQPKQHQAVDDDEVSSSHTRVKWSEQLLITRVMFISFITLLLAVIIPMFSEFMVAKSWTENTGAFFWLMSLTLITLWFLSLGMDKTLSQRLTKDWRGKLAISVMPLVFLAFSLVFVDQSVPLSLHSILSEDSVNQSMAFKKIDGKKRCRHRIEIIETREFEDTYLCLSKHELDKLPEKGYVTIVGSRSQFGLLIDRFSK
ncbi:MULTISPECIES: hypothetical protein [unclassified Alteromonas]|uniref:hypothetical protein n=1 Tax=unclassified Alteromonas TaxID=2614992 RepID=UPI0005098918|nr:MULTISPECIES: hypothetical protein [unclassified Alteromonas]